MNRAISPRRGIVSSGLWGRSSIPVRKKPSPRLYSRSSRKWRRPVLAGLFRLPRRFHGDHLAADLDFLYAFTGPGDGFADRFTARLKAAPTEQNLERPERTDLEIPQLLGDLGEAGLRGRAPLLRIDQDEFVLASLGGEVAGTDQR